MTTIAVVGLGYVGLPLAVALGKLYDTVGYDISDRKVAAYRAHVDPSGEVSGEELCAARRLHLTSDSSAIADAEFIIVTVPTPIDAARRPDLSPLCSASKTVGKHLNRGTIVVYESTVYPGATEQVCIPILEAESGLRWKEGFHVGYSPERVNPGDRERTLTRIRKVVAGDDFDTRKRIAALYASVISAGVYEASSIQVAEAAKVIENTQRDLNIALMNELAIIFDRLGIDSMEVLEAAETKWNFLSFRPGLVGGHCIGVDPYYLTHRAEMAGYHSEVILAGRRINDGMGHYVAQQTIKHLIMMGNPVKGATVNVLGITFKENCADLRNSKVADVVRELLEYGCDVSVHDPLAAPDDALHEYGFELASWDDLSEGHVLIAAVAHQQYRDMGLHQLLRKVRPNGLFIDVKAAYDASAVRASGRTLWRL